MIWLTWRQFRGQAVVALAALAALTVYLVLLGLRIRDAYDTNVGCAGCSVETARDALEDKYFMVLLLTGFAVVLVPALIGAFWGAPLVAREIETGTHRLVWNQSVTRTRWLAVKLTLVTGAAVALTGTLSALLTWAASPYDELVNGRFDPVSFPTRDIVPLGYAVFALVVGATIGLLIRRTVAAMAIVLAAFAVLQILVPVAIRPHLRPAVTATVTFDATSRQGARVNLKGGTASIEGYAMPGAWVLTGATALLDAADRPIAADEFAGCASGNPERDTACLTAKNAHFTVRYQPADRYWTFQWLEFTAYLVLAALLAGFAFWRIRRALPNPLIPASFKSS